MKATTTWTATDEIRVAKALGAARDKLRVQLGREPAGPEVISGVVADIDRRTPNDQPREPGNCWPDPIHDLDERNDAFKQRMIDVAAGDDIAVVFGMKQTPTDDEIETALAINKVFFSSLRDEKQRRDWEILRYSARGLSDTKIAKGLRISRQRVADRRKLQLTAIWNAVQHLMPAPTKSKRAAPKKTGVIWRNAA